jgi:hypothetical protein
MQSDNLCTSRTTNSVPELQKIWSPKSLLLNQTQVCSVCPGTRDRPAPMCNPDLQKRIQTHTWNNKMRELQQPTQSRRQALPCQNQSLPGVQALMPGFLPPS